MIEESKIKRSEITEKLDVFSVLNLDIQDTIVNDLRPDSFDNFIGQKAVLSQVKIMVDSAIKREDTCDHILFYGFPGLGKTSLARLIATEMRSNIVTTSGQAISKPGDMAAILSNLKQGDVLFIDEIHRLRTNVEEVLYTAMEDYFIDIVMGKGPTASSMKINIPKFTLVGATTLLDRISSPLRDRFGAVLKLEFYDVEDISNIIDRNAIKMDLKVSNDGLESIARASRGTPRIANNILKGVRDFALVKEKLEVDKDLVKNVLDNLGIFENGMDKTDVRILELLYSNSEKGAVGLKTLAAAVHESVETVENLHEPYLIQQGLIERTHRGRLLTSKGVRFLSQF